jgi:enoyl-[acyl-carrier protein] reductase II
MLINRVTELLGVEIPIVQAPMGWIARSTLASAVSNAGAMGIIETSSGELDAIRDEIAKMKDLTDKPFGVNIAQAFVADPTVIVDFVISQGVKFVTTSAGSPTKYTAQLKDAGLTVFHVVPTVRAADKAVTAGVDGLIVEGGEGGGFTIESPVHDGWKKAVIDATETDTVFLNGHTSPGLRALRTPYSERLEADHTNNAMASFGRVADVYFGGDLDAGIALGGQVAGRISASRPVADIIRDCAHECEEILRSLADRYVDR